MVHESTMLFCMFPHLVKGQNTSDFYLKVTTMPSVVVSVEFLVAICHSTWCIIAKMGLPDKGTCIRGIIFDYEECSIWKKILFSFAYIKSAWCFFPHIQADLLKIVLILGISLNIWRWLLDLLIYWLKHSSHSHDTPTCYSIYWFSLSRQFISVV